MLTTSESCASTPRLRCHLQAFLHGIGSSSISQRKWLGLTGLKHLPVVSTQTQVHSPNHHATLPFSTSCHRHFAWNWVHRCLLKEYDRLPYKERERESALVSTRKADRKLVGQGGTICMAPAGSWMCVGWLAVTSHVRLPGPREGAVPKPFITRDTDIFPGSNCVLAGEWPEAPEMSFVRGPFSL